jgi:hypothetical protein
MEISFLKRMFCKYHRINDFYVNDINRGYSMSIDLILNLFKS